MSTHVAATLRRLVAQRAQGICEYCLVHEDDTFLGCQIEHIIAEKHGGRSIKENLAFACVFCNRFKGSDIATLSPDGSGLCRLFNPRTDNWADHFVLVRLRIEGTTEVGKATVNLLRLNDSDRVLEREMLIFAGRYPSKSAEEKLKPG